MASARPFSGLLERDHEVELLLRAWRSARGGRGSAWFLCAEAGSGKTRLATEFSRISGGRTLRGTAEPVFPPDPYLAVIRAIPGFQPAPMRVGSTAGAIVALEEAAGIEPIIVVLDDLHYADEGTIAVVVRLCAECATRRWLVLAAFRPGEGPPGLLAPLVEVAAQGLAHRLDLSPLSRGAIASLIEALGGERTAAELDALYRDSGGNPWLAETLARGGSAVALAHNRIAIWLDRLEQVTPGTVRVLEALAPATRPLPHEVVATVCGGDSRALRRILSTLRSAGVLHEEEGAWGFRHELLRRSLLDAMAPTSRREAHRTLAEALVPLAGMSPGERTGGPAWSAADRRQGSAAELSMHLAAARDGRAAIWALRAAEEARAVDARVEAMAQFERALSFDLGQGVRRGALEAAAAEAYRLGRFADSQRLAEEALAIPGGEPETIAELHWNAARAAHTLGDVAADEAHLRAAERVLAGRPLSYQTVHVAVARVARAAYHVQPERLESTTERALGLARECGDPRAATAEVEVRMFLVMSLLDRADPSAFTLLDDLLAFAAKQGLHPGYSVTALANAYSEAVITLFHENTPALYQRAMDGLQRLQIGWADTIESYHVLELVQRGRYDDARAGAAAIPVPDAGTIASTLLTCAAVLREARGGSPERARKILQAAVPTNRYPQTALIDLARLELAMLGQDAGLGMLAQRIYGTANRRRYARLAGTAAVGLARSGRGAPPVPGWLAADSPLHVFWDWATGIVDGNRDALKGVAARLSAMQCPYEAALALREAGDVAGAYRLLRALEATTTRDQTLALLRATEQRVPRRTRSAIQVGGLTDTERAVCRLVAMAASNDDIAASLGISVRTVETHLTHIYRKTGARGRAALLLWWAEQSDTGS